MANHPISPKTLSSAFSLIAHVFKIIKCEDIGGYIEVINRNNDKYNAIKILLEKENISNDFLQSAFSKTEMIDFRINEVREMNPKVFEEITKEKT